MGRHENPVDFFRRVRMAIMEEFDNDIYKYGAYLREREKEHKDRLVDVEKLRKLGIISTQIYTIYFTPPSFQHTFIV